MTRILMIEDDRRLAEMVQDYLRQSGPDGADLVLLDLMLPDGDGLDVFRKLRALPAPVGLTPVIMLTAKGDPLDRVVGLEIGAEDYISKPFEPRELLARIRVVMRRGQPQAIADDVLSFGRLDIDRGARMARLGGVDLPLTSHQFALLLAMAERPGRVLSREQLLDCATGGPQTYDPALDRSIDVHVGRIRAVIEDDVKKPKRIITVRGAGYVFAKAQD
jgi:two-component system, OmpR family, phosphate regulon response regulator OmpR